MFGRFEKLLKPTEPPERPEPPGGLLAFYWHFARQAKWLFISLMVIELCQALFDAVVPWFIGRIVSLASTVPKDQYLAEAWYVLAGFALILLVVRPCVVFVRYLVVNQGISGQFTNLIRWQSHWHVARQSWAFFQNDFAGRIATRVMQTGGSLRQTMVSGISALWYVIVYGSAAVALAASADIWLTVPILLWFAGYIALLFYCVPRMRDRSKKSSEARSAVTGRIVDSYTNILTVKLFARARDEDDYVRDSIDNHTRTFLWAQRLMTSFGTLLSLLNGLLIAGAVGLAVALWQMAVVDIGAIAMVSTLTFHLADISRRIAIQIADIFEDVGVVQEGMMSIARPLELTDHAEAKPLTVNEGRIEFRDVRFGYGREVGVLEGFNLTVHPGERVGLVGRSGAGKSTVVNLLLRFFDLEGGQILIDGQDISRATQESLRAQISVVTQDTSLLHRSIRSNIRYGRRSASEEDVMAAARLAHADDFIRDLEDWRGNRGYDAHVGERGVKLSGGQRQRIAIARVILKNAPVLVLDEATSALDSEVEAAIQNSLDDLMGGKTVIAIAHRLSTIARMDRLVVLDHGRIVEQGSHDDLLRQGGHYAALWKRQSGGFIDAEPDEAPSASAAE